MALSRRGIELTDLAASFRAAKWELFAVAKNSTKKMAARMGRHFIQASSAVLPECYFPVSFGTEKLPPDN